MPFLHHCHWAFTITLLLTIINDNLIVACEEWEDIVYVNTGKLRFKVEHTPDLFRLA